MDIGVVIGRFQVDSLHDGHRWIIGQALSHHRQIVIFIGCAPILGTKHDPLDYPTRERMIRTEYPDAIVLPLYDHASDEKWSEQLDAAIRGVFPGLDRAVLYGGRGSFVKHYLGKFDARELDSPVRYRSGTEQREDLGKVIRSTPDFRAGMIYAAQRAFPHTRAAVDIAGMRLHDAEGKPLNWLVEILLGRKSIETKWRLPGGMVDPGESGEDAARREIMEEACVALDRIDFVGSFPIADWRFKNAGEIGVLTLLFTGEYTLGGVKARDDLAEVRWVRLLDAESGVVNGHKPLISALKMRYIP